MKADARARLSLAAMAACAVGLHLPVAQAQQSVNRCVDAAGRVSYQQGDCPEAVRQQSVKLHVTPAAPPASAAARRAMPGYKAPREAYLVFFYDPRDEPVGFSTATMESFIRTAATAWAQGCKVRIAYGGRAPARMPGTPDAVPIRWAPEYMRMAHPADARSGIAGTGSLYHGIALKPRFHENQMLSVLIHEMGHVLGLPHNHADRTSVMSYLRDEGAHRSPQPSESDYLNCNLSMQQLFGIEFQPPAGAEAARRPHMSDAEALRRIYGDKPR